MGTRSVKKYHIRQIMGLLPIEDGGFGDCFTTKGIKYYLAQLARNDPNIVTSTWIVKGATADMAVANANRVINDAIELEIVQSKLVMDKHSNVGYMEKKAKEHVGYNAAFRYHCYYQERYGENPRRELHPAWTQSER